MAPMLKRRKILDRPARPFDHGTTVSMFGKVTKPAVVHIISKKEIDSESEDERRHKPARCAAKSNKRRREEEKEESNLREQSGNIIRVAPNQDQKRLPLKKVRFAIVQESKRPATNGNSIPIRSCLTPSPVKVEDVFSEEIQDLIDLHGAFLNALAVHYAHYGTASPVEIRALIAQVEQKWGKRRILIEDIQRVLGIQHSEQPSPLSLAQRNKSRICIEYDTAGVYPLPVESLKKYFRSAIEKIQNTSLPLEEIKIYTVEEDALLSKGAQRLQDIKNIALKAQPSAPKPIQSQPEGTPATRATSLLSRIMQKENLAATGPAAPTAASLARKASLQRLEEIIPILCVLSGSSTSVSGRNLYNSTTSLASLSALGSSLGLGPVAPAKIVSFTMSNVVQHLQNSMRHPVAKEEVVQAVRLLAEEVAPKWIGVRDVGNVTGVTFRGKIGRAEWSGRVQALMSQ